MSRSRRHVRSRSFVIIIALVTLLVSACGLGQGGAALLVRSDPPITGMVTAASYRIETAPNGKDETNVIETKGMGTVSPVPLVTTSYESGGASSVSQTAMVTAPNGTQVAALSMVRRNINFGLTDSLSAQISTYEQRDVKGDRICGAKVRMTFQPTLAQDFFHDKYQRAWDVLFYYSIPCVASATSSATLNLSGAKLIAMVIDQQTTPRVVYGKPIFFNRGHSVTLVGGAPAKLAGGWWSTNLGLLAARDLVKGLVDDLDQHQWLGFSANGPYATTGMVYSAGDADVYLSLARFFLNRQSDYLVNYRAKPTDPWQRVLVHPIYNKEWNDFEQNYQALKGQSMPPLDQLVDKTTGIPKHLDDPTNGDYKALKEIETAGCQNCPNAELEQIQFLDPATKAPLYVFTIRGYLGSNSSLFMAGNLPKVTVDQALGEADKRRAADGQTTCPVFRDSNGNPYTGDSHPQYTASTCAEWLREGALWDMLTQDPSKFGFDLVGQFEVRDNSSFASQCSGSGNNTVCSTVVTNHRMDASYLFDNAGAKLRRAWTALQLLGEVGMRTLGMSYASGAYDGSGIDFAMAQMQVNNAYYSNILDPKAYNQELLFGLDARALQLPSTLAQAGQILAGQP